MDKKMVILRIFLIIAAGFIIAFYFRSGEVFIECKNDKDCSKVETMCCYCNMGGTQKCVNSTEAVIYSKNRESCSEDIRCAAVDNCNINQCSCVGGKCLAS